MPKKVILKNPHSINGKIDKRVLTFVMAYIIILSWQKSEVIK